MGRIGRPSAIKRLRCIRARPVIFKALPLGSLPSLSPLCVSLDKGRKDKGHGTVFGKPWLLPKRWIGEIIAPLENFPRRGLLLFCNVPARSWGEGTSASPRPGYETFLLRAGDNKPKRGRQLSFGFAELSKPPSQQSLLVSLFSRRTAPQELGASGRTCAMLTRVWCYGSK